MPEAAHQPAETKLNVTSSSALAETPTESIVNAARTQFEVADAKGRSITFRKLSPVQQMDFAITMGAERMAIPEVRNTYMVVFSVTAIDGERIAPPMNFNELRATLGRLDQDGLDAVTDEMFKVGLATRPGEEMPDLREAVGNS